MRARFNTFDRLILAGSNIEEEDDAGWTSLFYQVRRESLEGVERLLALGANLNHKQHKYGYTALTIARLRLADPKRGLRKEFKLLITINSDGELVPKDPDSDLRAIIARLECAHAQ